MNRPPVTVVTVQGEPVAARWIGVFCSESGNYAPGDITSSFHRLAFHSIDQAAEFMHEIHETGQDSRTGTRWPLVRSGDALHLYRAFRVAEQDEAPTTDIWPTHVLTLGPRGGVKEERV